MYRETLMAQWNNLYSDFAGEYEILKKQENVTASFNHWYEARVHRWNSITYPEGIILEQLNKPDFSRELKKAFKGFKFEEVKPAEEKPLWMGIAAGIAAGVLAGGILTLLHWGKTEVIISGVVLLAAVIVVFFKKNADDGRQEEKRVKEEYIQQLRDYQKELIAVCNRYQM